MEEIIETILPNVASHPERFLNGLLETFIMTIWSGAISFVLGLLIGITITVTKKGGVLENRVVYQIFDKLINLFRSIPFIILLTGVMPLSRLIMGTAIGIRGAIVPLICNRRKVSFRYAWSQKGKCFRARVPSFNRRGERDCPIRIQERHSAHAARGWHEPRRLYRSA